MGLLVTASFRKTKISLGKGIKNPMKYSVLHLLMFAVWQQNFAMF